MISEDINNLKFDEKGLIPAIIQDVNTGEVLMMAYMNKEALEKTIQTGKTWFWSRSRQQFWNKGETSGHFQYVKSISYDCDADTLLIEVEQVGNACHTGAKTCFHNLLFQVEGAKAPEGFRIIQELYKVILDRKEKRPEGSYTVYLFAKGLDKILKKVGEETAEVIIGAKNEKKEEVIYEVADLLYHLLVLLAQQDIKPEEIFKELAKRR